MGKTERLGTTSRGNLDVVEINEMKTTERHAILTESTLYSSDTISSDSVDSQEILLSNNHYSESHAAVVTAPRTIDFFLNELHLKYQQKILDRLDDISNTNSNLIKGAKDGVPSSSEESDIKRGFRDGRHFNIFRHVYHYCIYTSSFHYIPLPLLALCIANSSDATEILMLSYLLANSRFREDMFSSINKIDVSESLATTEGAEYLAASIFLGMLLGGTVLGFLSDSIGRRPTLLFGLITNAVAGTLSSIPFITPTYIELTALRFIAGIGIGATVPPLFSLASEWSPKELRGSIVTAVASFWMVGSLFVSGIAWGLFYEAQDANYSNLHLDDKASTWRIFVALCALPSALGAWMVYLYVPESPRFLASKKNDFEESSCVCNELAKNLGIQIVDATSNEDTLVSRMPHVHALTAEELKSSMSMKAKMSYSHQDDNITSTSPSKILQILHSVYERLSQLYSPQLMFQTTLPLKILWFSISFGTYGITTWINSLFVAVHMQNLYLNSFLFALANLPGNIITAKYADKWGRKSMLIGSSLGAAGGLLGFAVMVYSGNNSDNTSSQLQIFGIVLFACLFQMFSIVSWNAIDILSGELFPTCVRSAGMGICTASGRVGAMVAQVVNARLMISTSNNSTVQEDSDTVASIWVLVIAAIALLLGAGMPFFVGKDRTGGVLEDEVVNFNAKDGLSTFAGCLRGDGERKQHLSDEEIEENIPLDEIPVIDYDLFRRKMKVNDPLLL